MVAMFGRRGCLGGHLGSGARWRINTNGRFLLARVRDEVCLPEMALSSLLCQFWSPLCIRCPNAHSVLISIYHFGSHGPNWDYCGESLCILAPDGLFHHTEQDWNLARIRSRTHVSIITDLMRTMNLLLACVHHSLNP